MEIVILPVPIPVSMLIQTELTMDGPFNIDVDNGRLIISNPAAEPAGFQSVLDMINEALDLEARQ